MKQDYIILLPFAALAALVLLLTIIAVLKFRKLYANKDHENGHMECNDIPGRYMEILDREHPFIELY